MKHTNSFQECILKRIEFFNFGTSLKIEIINVWDEKGIQIPEFEQKVISLMFTGVKVFEMTNEYTEAHLNNLEMTNWGYNELSKIDFIEKDDSNFKNQVHLLWESGREITIVSKELRVITV